MLFILKLIGGWIHWHNELTHTSSSPVWAGALINIERYTHIRVAISSDTLGAEPLPFLDHLYDFPVVTSDNCDSKITIRISSAKQSVCKHCHSHRIATGSKVRFNIFRRISEAFSCLPIAFARSLRHYNNVYIFLPSIPNASWNCGRCCGNASNFITIR